MWPTASSIVSIWNISDTFTHGYFVLPVFFYLVWVKRHKLPSTCANPDWRAIPPILICSAIWLLAQQSGIQVVEHTALVLILILGIWAVVGAQIARAISFPLMFLIFLAPVGDELVPALMELTADFTVWAIAASGVPIYREGLFFSLPSGNWSVVEACSGIRYLIASIMLGSVYAYLNYESVYRRLVFITLAAIVPIIANSLRAYLIVMLGHVSGNKLATGVDHLVYGWAFFGLIMFALFALGATFHEKTSPNERVSTSSKDQNNEAIHRVTNRPFMASIFIWLIAICAIVAGPVWSANIQKDAVTALSDERVLELLPAGFKHESGNSDVSNNAWEPIINGFNHQLEANYATAHNSSVRAQAFVYYNQEQGREMIASTNKLVGGINSQWRLSSEPEIKMKSAKGDEYIVSAYKIRSDKSDLNLLRWYNVNGVITNSQSMAKLYELKNRLLLKDTISIHYILSANSDNANAEKALRSVAIDYLLE